MKSLNYYKTKHCQQAVFSEIMEEVIKFENIYFFDSIESTNLYAQEHIKSKKITANSIIVAKHQSKGRGQRGNKWLSNDGENLLFSLIWFPDSIVAEELFYISKITSLALRDFIQSLTDGQIKIKWPNDIYCKGKKIAGILIENNIMGNKISSSIIGMGVNINQENFSKEINATSIFLDSGKKHQLTNLPLDFLDFFRKWYGEYINYGKKAIDSAYLNEMYALGENKNYRDKEGEFRAKIIGVTENGLLQIEKENGTIKHYDLKEIKFIA